MDTVSLPVDDGSALVLVGTTMEPERPDGQGEAPILGPVADFVQQLLVDGALIGVTGNASYDLLKALHRLQQQRGILAKAPAPALDDVRERVAKALTAAGHHGPVFDEIRQNGDQGWDLNGTVATQPFTARADPNGQVIHLRVG
jgi:hypothetical protein